MDEISLDEKLPSSDCHWTYRWQINTASGNGVALSGTKPLPVSIWTQISVDSNLCHHMVSLGHNELKYMCLYFLSEIRISFIIPRHSTVLAWYAQDFNSLRPSDAYMCMQTNHHWLR